MPPFSQAFQRLSSEFSRKKNVNAPRSFDNGPLSQETNCTQPKQKESPIHDHPVSVFGSRSILSEPITGNGCTETVRKPPGSRPDRPKTECGTRTDLQALKNERERVGTYLRPDELLMGNINVGMDYTKPFLVGNTLMREIPLRDTSRVLDDKELRSLHWIIGESVERHAERTARYFANLFRSRNLSDVTVYVGENKIRTHKLVLAAFSIRFHKQLLNERLKNLLIPEVCIDVSQLQTRALLRCIEFIYKGSTEIHHYNAAEVLNVAQSLKLFPLAHICKNKLKSEQYSELFPRLPKDRHDVATGNFSLSRKDVSVQPESETELKKCSGDVPCERSIEKSDSQKLQDDIRQLATGPVDFYKITGNSCFLAWPLEMVEALFQNNDMRINSELDVMEAMTRWLRFRPEERKIYTNQLLGCVRFVHATPQEMLQCGRIAPDLFESGTLKSVMAKAKWKRDLIERGVFFGNMDIPKCRVVQAGYWAAPDGCEQPIDNIYGEDLPVEGNSLAQPISRSAQAARAMVSKSTRRTLCDKNIKRCSPVSRSP